MQGRDGQIHGFQSNKEDIVLLRVERDADRTAMHEGGDIPVESNEHHGQETDVQVDAGHDVNLQAGE